MVAMTRDDYAKLLPEELERRLKGARERITRAETTDDYLADAFAIQEMEAVLEDRADQKYAAQMLDGCEDEEERNAMLRHLSQ